MLLVCHDAPDLVLNVTESLVHLRQSAIRGPTSLLLNLEARIEVKESAIGRLRIGDSAWSRPTEEVLLICVHLLSGEFVRSLSARRRRVYLTVVGSRAITVQWQLELRPSIDVLWLLLGHVHCANCISRLLFRVL